MIFKDNHTTATTDLRRTVRTLEIFTVIGLLFSILAISESSGELLYFAVASWFAVALMSFESILNFYKIGVYAIIVATLVLTVVEFATGTATLLGASLALILTVILYNVIKPVWDQFE